MLFINFAFHHVYEFSMTLMVMKCCFNKETVFLILVDEKYFNSSISLTKTWDLTPSIHRAGHPL